MWQCSVSCWYYLLVMRPCEAMALAPHWALIHHLCSHIIVLIITGDVNVTSVAPPQQRMTAQSLWTARRAMSVLHLACCLNTHTLAKIQVLSKVNHTVCVLTTYGMLDSFWRRSSRLFFIDTEKYLCVKTKGL